MQTCVYADDVLIVSRTQKTMTDTFTKLKGEASRVGMTINESKKYRYCRRQAPRNVPPFEETNIEQLNHFISLRVP
jgi:hypothetical protein